MNSEDSTMAVIPAEIDVRANAFETLMMEYQCAMFEVKTKLDVLNAELSHKESRNPIEAIKTRLKQPKSIIEKLQRNNWDVNVASIEEHLSDVAGIRVICSFEDDIYKLVDCLLNQDDITLIKKKDYIAKPKESGYRSLHLIVEVPIFLTTEKKPMKVEVQFRTVGMDFWATLEHKLKYKKNIEMLDNPESIAEELFYCADLVHQLDGRMMQIRKKIEDKQGFEVK